jgi:Uma2 family endonuclease
MAAILEQKTYTLLEYLNSESRASEKHIFIKGKIIPKAGGTARHNEISANVIAALNIAIRSVVDQKYRLYTSDMKIWMPARERSYYPDALVIAERPNFYEGRKDIITNPLLIVEVMSPSSEDSDRGAKFYDYRTISTFQEYLLLHQEQPQATRCVRQGDDLWRLTDFEGMDAVIELASIGQSVRLADLYHNIDFEEGM